MTKTFNVKELVEIINGLEPAEKFTVCAVLSGDVSDILIASINIIKKPHDEQPDLLRELANWNLEDFPEPHEDDSILLLLEELLESKR